MALKIMLIDGIFMIGDEDSGTLNNPRIISFLEVDILDSKGRPTYFPSGEKKIGTLIKMPALPGFPKTVPITERCYVYELNSLEKATVELYKRLTTQPPQGQDPVIFRQVPPTPGITEGDRFRRN